MLVRWGITGVLAVVIACGTWTAAAERASRSQARDLAAVGKPIPADVVVEDYSGKTVKLASALSGKPTILTFWATWCAPCLKEMPTFQKIVDTYDGKLQVVAVGMMDPKTSAAAFVQRHPEYRFRFLHDPAAEGGDSEVASAFGVVGLPTNLFVDAGGIVRDKWLGSASDEALIQRIRKLMDSAQ